MQTLLEYIPLIAFFLVYKFVDIYWAAGALAGGALLSLILLKLLKKPISKTTYFLFIFTLVMATLTIFFRDEDFIKWKFTIMYFGFGSILLVSRYLMNKNLIKSLMHEAFELPTDIWNKVNLGWAFFFYFCSALNIYIAANWSLDEWVNFKVFGVLAMTFVFLVLTVVYIYPYLPEEDKE